MRFYLTYEGFLTEAAIVEGPIDGCRAAILNAGTAYAIGSPSKVSGDHIMAQVSGLMAGKRGVIMGVANNRSIAWGIAKACRDQGAEIALTWQGDALKKRVEPLAQELNAFLAGDCSGLYVIARILFRGRKNPSSGDGLRDFFFRYRRFVSKRQK